MTDPSQRAAAKCGAIEAIYAAVRAPHWAAPNLDGLTDVLRDLSWLPPGRVTVVLPPLGGLVPDDRDAVLRVLARAVAESSATERPIVLAEPTG